jgi:hypothetical protein
MNVKEAIAAARDHFLDAFSDYEKQKPSLEEVWFDDVSSHWYVTFGLQRQGSKSFMDPLSALSSMTIYKVVELSDKDGKLISIKVRQPERV